MFKNPETKLKDVAHVLFMIAVVFSIIAGLALLIISIIAIGSDESTSTIVYGMIWGLFFTIIFPLIAYCSCLFFYVVSDILESVKMNTYETGYIRQMIAISLNGSQSNNKPQNTNNKNNDIIIAEKLFQQGKITQQQFDTIKNQLNKG